MPITLQVISNIFKYCTTFTFFVQQFFIFGHFLCFLDIFCILYVGRTQFLHFQVLKRAKTERLWEKQRHSIVTKHLC